MSPTAGAILDSIVAELHGWGGTSDLVTPLTADIGAADTNFTVDFTYGQATGVSPGMVQIDQEQLFVTTIDPGTGICTLARGFGRGYGDTVAAAHTAGSQVISQPTFPRIWVMDQLNKLIDSLYPTLYSVQTFQTVVAWPNNTYTLPKVPSTVIDVQWQDPIGRWVRVNGYMVDPYDGTFRLGDGALIGRPLRIVYGAQPTKFAVETDLLSGTGLQDSVAELLQLGVVAKQLPGMDISRAQANTIEQTDRSRIVPPNAGITASKYIMALFQDRLQNEAQSLRKRYKTRMVRVW